MNSAGQQQTSYSYDLLGKATSSAGASDPNPLRYTGLISGPSMPAGLQDNNARDYSPATGRFISQDPIGMSGSANDLYAYASGDPVDYSDPSGLEVAQLLACGLGAVFNDVAGAADGNKHSFGDFFAGALGGCLQGLAFTIPGAGEGLIELEGFGAAADAAASDGVAGAQDLTTLGDDFAGDGTGYDWLGDDACTAGMSFAGSTPVMLADGTTKPIDQVKPGDKVLATNTTTGKTSPEAVTAVSVRRDTDLYDLKVKSGGQVVVIHTTSNHPFWDPQSRKWVQAGRLRAGEPLRTADGTPATVIGGSVPTAHDGWMWDLTVPGDNDHDFYVDTGDTPVLVHNTCGPTNDITGESQSYIDRTIGGSIRNVGTSATHTEFSDTLTNNGWNALTSKDGTVQIFTKDGAKYVLREKAGSYSGWSADFTPAGSPRVTLKILLGVAG